MKIVLSLSSYAELTGAPLYVHDLANELAKRKHTVSILANQIGVQLVNHTNKEVTIYPFFNHPDLAPDVVISSQPAPANYCVKTFPDAFHIQVLHSLLSYEEPVIHRYMKYYICVRPEIEAYWVNEKPELKGSTVVIWNGVDSMRFNTKDVRKTSRFIRLFVGTFDHLRRDVILDLMKDSSEKNEKLWLVMPHNPFVGESSPPKTVKTLPATWDIEKYVKLCDETAGIFIGRTTIEGWMCGKPGLVYDVDPTGKITRKATYGVPENLEMFDIRYMTDRILTLV